MGLILLFYVVTPLLFQFSQCATLVINEKKNLQLRIGDSVIFQHNYHYNLYIFQNQKAFTHCNFSQATLLTKPNSSISYIWRTSRPGSFYFMFDNGSNNACLQGQKFVVKVSPPEPQNHASSPPSLPQPPLVSPSPSPSPLSGGIVVSPFQPSPSPAPGLLLSASSPVAPDKQGIPFISSNPVVPLPTGEVDSATIRPLPTSDHPQVLGFAEVQRALCCLSLLLMII